MDPSLLLIILICIIILFVCIAFSNNYLIVKKYTYESEKIPSEFNGVKIVHISDLHSKRFGKNNGVLINKIEKLNPDYIFMTGDIIDKRENDIKKFIKELKPIFDKYVVYYSIGNHERALGYKKYVNYVKELEKCGVHVLRDDSMYIDSHEKINIVGLNFKDNIRYEKNYAGIDRDLTYLRSKSGQVDLNKFNILLAHDPLNFELYHKLGFDLIFSGHVHGGLIRVFKIGLLSPRRKLFPKYCVGKYVKNESTMFVSTGLGRATIPIRLFNHPEISLIKLKMKKVDENIEE
ncbi:MAG: metallophosphoesterase [Clostridia bacterium]|nr:metallophosphoesterase [Clostridia bacterium]